MSKYVKAAGPWHGNTSWALSAVTGISTSATAGMCGLGHVGYTSQIDGLACDVPGSLPMLRIDGYHTTINDLAVPTSVTRPQTPATAAEMENST